MKDTKESIEYWKIKKQEVGKEIIFKSFTRFLGESGKKYLDLSGLLYSTEEFLYFEDFEKSTMFDFLMRSKKSEYKKFIMKISLNDITRMKRVTESSAIACIKDAEKKAVAPGIFGKLTRSIIWELELEIGKSYFFEIFEHKELSKIINND